MEWSITVWDVPRLAYVAVPKAANTAVKAALLSSYVKKQRWGNPHSPSMPYVEATKEELASSYDEFLTFTVVRNPFDRFVSFWADKVAGNGWYASLGRQGFRPGMGFEDAAVVAAGLPDATTDPHLRSQRARLTFDDGSPIPQVVLRFEDLIDGWEGLRRIAAQRAKPSLAAIEVRRPSVHMSPAHYYTPASEQAVLDRYGADFELLGYVTEVGAESAADPSALHRLVRLVRRRPATIVIDAVGSDEVRRQLVRSAGGVYLACGSTADPSAELTSVSDAVRRVGGDATIVVLHDASTDDDEVASLPADVTRFSL